MAPRPGYTSIENTVLEAVLKTDGSGSMVLFPWVQQQLQRRLAEWAYKACTAGGLSFPAFALADDGFLIVREGDVYSSADWMPYKRLLFQAQVTGDGKVLGRANSNGQPEVVRQVHPFPVTPGRGEARNGKVIFPGSVQRRQVNTHSSRPQARGA
ncbi:MAG: hypothetical protein ACRD18_04890 [Terriglobia bacterium]